MMADFLLELFSEEIPARMQPAAAAQLRSAFEALLADAGLGAERVEAHATPRRLTLLAWGLPAASAAVREERRGPRADAPAGAVAGFLKSTGLAREALEERDDPKGRFLYAVIEKPGRPAADLLAERLPAMIAGFQWPKSMRWGATSASTASPRWVRPLRRIVALLDGDVVPFEALGVASGRETFGHRFLSSGAVSVASAGSYAAQLRDAKVIVDAGERAAVIRDGAARAAAAAGLALVPDAGLEAENAGLTEWPVPLLGRFDPAFLSVPREIIQLTMRTNQKYFAVNRPPPQAEVSAQPTEGASESVATDDAPSVPLRGPPPPAGEDSALAPAFVCVANIEAADGGARIVAGNERVLSARLADARFFWERDLAVPLQAQAPKLERIVFHAKLGTVADKVERVAKLARWLAERIPGCDADLAEQAARLAKCDLVTGTVGEFPEVQGIAGGYLARAQGEPDAVADAVRDHYKPVGQGDEVPTAPVTVAVALADKLDIIFEFFGSQERPTGSKDPYGLRRAAIGALEILLRSKLRISLQPLMDGFFWWQVRQWNAKPGQRVYGWSPVRLEEWASEDGGPPIVAETRDFVDVESYEEDIFEENIDIFTAHRFNYHDSGNSDFEDNVQSGRQYIIPDLRILRREVVPFLTDRLKVQQRDAGTRHDVIDAVFVLGDDDLVRLLARVRAVQGFLGSEDGANLLSGYKRAANILKKEGFDQTVVIPANAGTQEGGAGGDEGAASANLLGSRVRGNDGDGEFEAAERALIDTLAQAGPAVAAAVDQEDFEGAMRALATLRGPVDAFFEQVKVNADDPAVRLRRLALLAAVRDAMHRVADFSRIEG